MDRGDRLRLFQTLSSLSPSQFGELLFALNPPKGTIPDQTTAQSNRVYALTSWAEGPTGCGLDGLGVMLEELWPGILEDENVGGDEGFREATRESHWSVPYRRNPFFTGRNEILATLHQQLHDDQSAAISQTQAISGLGGIGKTQTAVEYAYRYRDNYRYVFWAQADTELELTGSYVEIARLMDLPLKDAENQDKTVQSVRRWLANEDGWLLIFDNADSPQIVQPFLPREWRGHVLVTSRAQDFQDLGIVQPMEIETLSSEEAVAFLLLRTGNSSIGAPDLRSVQSIEPLKEDPFETSNLLGIIGRFPDGTPSIELEAAAKLAAELGCLPLALEQAAAYIVTNKVSFQDYLKGYRKQRLKRLEKAKPKLGNYPDSVVTTWALNLKEVQKQSAAAAELLRYSAFLHPDAIPFELFTRGAHELLGEPLAAALAATKDDLLELYDLLNPLCSYSLILVDGESHSYSIHRLVQEVIRSEIDDVGCVNRVELLFRSMRQLVPDKNKDIDYQDWPALAPLAPLVNHVRELAQHYPDGHYASTYAADMFHIVGAYLLERGQYNLAKPLLHEALELRRRWLGNEHIDIAASLDRIARSHQLQGHYSDAEPFYQAALAMRKQLLGDEHPDVATSLNNLAVLCREQGRYSDAESVHQAALAMREKLLGDEHPDVATSLSNLAVLYREQGRLSDAEPLSQSALAMRKRLLGNEHPSVAISLNELALLYSIKGRYSDAEPLYHEALAMTKRLFGDEHPDVARILNNLALLYSRMGYYSKAEPLYQEALAMEKGLFGYEHPNISSTLNNLALLYYNQGKYEEAESTYKEVLLIDRKIFGEESPEIATGLHNLALVYRNQARYTESEDLFVKALEIKTRFLSEEHPLVSDTLFGLGVLYHLRKKFEQAEEKLLQALDIDKKSLGETHPNTAESIRALGDVHSVQGRTEEARSLYEHALSIFETKLGAEHPLTIGCRENLENLGRQ